jgi:glycosyltransferase involved in cell wall biosynthesis
MPLISIIIPAYNVEKYIADTIISIKNQDFHDYEVIIINDGSTDNTLLTAETAIQHDSRFTIITTHNGGLSRARNAGKATAIGEYIYFLDGDDKLSEFALATIANSITTHKPHAILFNSIVFTDGTNQFDTKLSESYTRNLTSPIKAGSSLLMTAHNCRPIVSACMYIVRRDMANDTFFLPGALHEDNPYFAEVFFEHIQTTIFIDAPLFLRRIRPNSIMSTATSVRNIDGYLAGATHLCSRLPTYTRGEPVEIMHEFIRNMLWDAIFLLHRLKMGTDTAMVKRRILGTCGLLYSLNGMTLRQLFSFTRAIITARAGA